MVATCTNPVVKFEAYSTGDIYLSSETVFIIEAEVQCKGTEVRKKQLFLLGNLVQLGVYYLCLTVSNVTSRTLPCWAFPRLIPSLFFAHGEEK